MIPKPCRGILADFSDKTSYLTVNRPSWFSCIIKERASGASRVEYIKERASGASSTHEYTLHVLDCRHIVHAFSATYCKPIMRPTRPLGFGLGGMSMFKVHTRECSFVRKARILQKAERALTLFVESLSQVKKTKLWRNSKTSKNQNRFNRLLTQMSKTMVA